MKLDPDSEIALAFLAVLLVLAAVAMVAEDAGVLP